MESIASFSLHIDRIPLSRIIQKRRDPVEELVAADVDDVGMSRAGDLEPPGWFEKSRGQAACFEDRDDPIVGPLDE